MRSDPQAMVPLGDLVLMKIDGSNGDTDPQAVFSWDLCPSELSSTLMVSVRTALGLY